MAITSNDPRNPKLSTPNEMRHPVYGILEADSQSFKAGELVYLSSGAATVCASDATKVYGIALKDATNVTSGNIEIPILPIYPQDDLIMQVSSGGTVEAANTTCTPGTNYGLVVSSNHHTVDSAETSTEVFHFERELLKADGSADYWAVVHLLATVAQTLIE